MRFALSGRMTLAFPPRLDARVRQPVHGLVAFLLPGLWPPNASATNGQQTNALFSRYLFVAGGH